MLKRHFFLTSRVIIGFIIIQRIWKRLLAGVWNIIRTTPSFIIYHFPFSMRLFVGRKSRGTHFWILCGCYTLMFDRTFRGFFRLDIHLH
uniref:Uncharacterized protein n=1 Tax=Lepeophtheirus salmonis TaxID=72036 RepID=A0A0K2V1B5_LEPSM